MKICKIILLCGMLLTASANARDVIYTDANGIATNSVKMVNNTLIFSNQYGQPIGYATTTGNVTSFLNQYGQPTGTAITTGPTTVISNQYGQPTGYIQAPNGLPPNVYNVPSATTFLPPVEALVMAPMGSTIQPLMPIQPLQPAMPLMPLQPLMPLMPLMPW